MEYSKNQTIAACFSISQWEIIAGAGGFSGRPGNIPSGHNLLDKKYNRVVEAYA